MKIAITGSSGLIGSALVHRFREEGHAVTRLVRRQADTSQGEISWNPTQGETQGEISRKGLEGHDAVINLAGETIAARWTKKKKEEIRTSRVEGTRLLADALAGLAAPPQVFISGSAIGYYGDRGDETLDEQSAPGSDFLAEVCRQWEAATETARAHGIRVAFLRTGIVLSEAGGALPKMLTPFRMGLGGKVGSGDQYMSWIALEDMIKAVGFLLRTSTMEGPVNMTAPSPVRNSDFTKALAHTLSRPAVVPLPGFAAHLIFGEMADALMLSSARVLPKRLLDAGFSFEYPQLEGALRHILDRTTAVARESAAPLP